MKDRSDFSHEEIAHLTADEVMAAFSCGLT